MAHYSGRTLRLRGFSLDTGRVDPIWLFAVEGIMLQYATSINGFANNLFATALGANDLQIGLIQTVPNVAAMLLLLPLGILADRMRSSRTLPLVCLLCVEAGFLLMSAVPAFGGLRIPAFFFALAFTVGGPVLYNAQWQTFFGDVVEEPSRNRVLTLRNRAMFLIGIAAPLVCGAMMSVKTPTLATYQLFFMTCALGTVIQAAVLSAIRPPVRQRKAVPFSTHELTDAVRTLAKSREFRLFFVPVVLFYMTWQVDWSMWYIGQSQYLQLTESQMTMFSGLFNIGQLVAVGLLSGVVQRKGADRALPYTALGLMSCPAIMMLCSWLPMGSRMLAFTVLVTLLNAPQCGANLCIVQILLRVAPRECRSIAVSLYTLTITLTNCFMPYLGVQFYTALGSDYRALMLFNAAVFIGRGLTFALLLWRCRYVKKP